MIALPGLLKSLPLAFTAATNPMSVSREQGKGLWTTGNSPLV